MARIGIIFGLLLCGLTYVGLVLTTAKSPIQFIPMMIGIPTLFCGVVALNPHRRKYAIRAAAILALLGASLGGFRSLVWLTRWMRNEAIDHFAVGMNVALLLICGTFLLICIGSFVQDRRRRHAKRAGSIPFRPSLDQKETESHDGTALVGQRMRTRPLPVPTSPTAGEN